MKKIAMAALLAVSVLPASSFADTTVIRGPAGGAAVIRKGPPAAVVERYGVAPRRGFVWTPGYHNWVGGRYVWVPGKWARPPYAGAVWVPFRWIRRPNGGWVLLGGHWRR